MKRWLLIAVAALLTLGGLAWFGTPAMAGDYHPRHAPVSVSCYPAVARHNAHVRHAAHVHAAHVRTYRHAAHRR